MQDQLGLSEQQKAQLKEAHKRLADQLLNVTAERFHVSAMLKVRAAPACFAIAIPPFRDYTLLSSLAPAHKFRLLGRLTACHVLITTFADQIQIFARTFLHAHTAL